MSPLAKTVMAVVPRDFNFRSPSELMFCVFKVLIVFFRYTIDHVESVGIVTTTPLLMVTGPKVPAFFPVVRV